MKNSFLHFSRFSTCFVTGTYEPIPHWLPDMINLVHDLIIQFLTIWSKGRNDHSSQWITLGLILVKKTIGIWYQKDQENWSNDPDLHFDTSLISHDSNQIDFWSITRGRQAFKMINFPHFRLKSWCLNQYRPLSSIQS